MNTEHNSMIYTKAYQSTSHCISTFIWCSIPVRFVSSIVHWSCRFNSFQVTAAEGQINTNSMHVKTNKYWHSWDANNALDTDSVVTALIGYYNIIMGGLTALQAKLLIKASDWSWVGMWLVAVWYIFRAKEILSSSPMRRLTLQNTTPHVTFHKMHCSAPIVHWVKGRHDECRSVADERLGLIRGPKSTKQAACPLKLHPC